jgi:hypothetical protein
MFFPLVAAAALALPTAEQAPPPERALAELARAALAEPAAVRTWAAIARTLRELRPELHRDVPSPAERTAFEIVATVAERAQGAIRELRIEPVAPYTEIAIHGAGSVPYRIVERGTSTAPRLVLTLRGATNALAESDYKAIGRGGVRALHLTDTGTDIELAVDLEKETDFALHRRGDRLVLRIQNRAGAFAPWSTEQQGWGAIRLAARSESPAAEREPQRPEAAELLPAVTTPAVVRTADAPIAADAPAAETVSPAPTAEAREDTAEAAPAEAGAGKAPLGTRARGVADAAAGRLRDALAQPVTPATALVIAGVIALALAAGALLRLRARKRSALAGALDGADPQSDPRLWVARTLAADGASVEEIAQRTGLTRDAVLLLLPPSPPPAPEETADSGTFFPPGQLPSTYTPRGGKWLKH